MPTANPRPIPILMYHQIAPPPPRGTPFRGLVVDPQRFAGHMRALHRLGYQGLAMRDLMPYLAGERQGRVFGLTFDDGFANVLDNAGPVLAALGFTATNYCVAAHPGGTNAWDAGHGVAPQRLMTVAQMRAWVAAGHEIGSHTLDHVDLTTLPLAEVRHQMVASRQRLEDAIGTAVTAFCYPYGHYGPDHPRLVRDAGFQSATTTQRGRVQAHTDYCQLPRVTVVRSTHLLALWQKIATRYEDRRSRQ